jgi:hypothetical protein
MSYDILSEVLDHLGLTTDCENPTVVCQFEYDGETVIAYLDGGDGYQPGLLFARWVGEFSEDNETLGVHVPEPNLNTLLIESTDDFVKGYVYHLMAADSEQDWLSIDSLMHHKPIMEPVELF